MKKTSTAILVSMFVTAVALSGAMAQKRDGSGWHRGHPGKMKHLISQLDLTDAQQAKVTTLHTALIERMDGLRQDLRTLRSEMRALWDSDVPNREAILDKQGELHAIKGQMAELHLGFRLDVYALLTPQQQQRARAMFSKMGHRGYGKGRGYGFGHGKGRGGECPFAEK
ncbi:MAG: Spy/CpxP family protein refolding chaperone [Myxococcota bacterium]|nr:Spy/CpxP family protein refolding chaperone [Myxococcota bacterium]